MRAIQSVTAWRIRSSVARCAGSAARFADLMRIGLRVVELLGRPARPHPQRGRPGQLPFRLQPEPLLHDGALVAIDDVPGVRQLGREVADVEEPRVARRAHHVVLDVHAVARGKHELRRRPGLRARRARAPGRCAGISTPASASTVGARSMKLTSSSLTEPGVTVEPSAFGHRIISGTRRPES